MNEEREPRQPEQSEKPEQPVEDLHLPEDDAKAVKGGQGAHEMKKALIANFPR